MKIEWNKVTWYSKLLAGIIFIVLPFFAFYLGYYLGTINGQGNIGTLILEAHRPVNMPAVAQPTHPAVSK
jgi:hypothetical protein